MLREHNALAFLSPLETDPQILEREVRLGKFCWAIDFGLESLASRNVALVNRTLRIGFRMVELFRKIDGDFGGSTSWNTQHKFFDSFNKATAL